MPLSNHNLTYLLNQRSVNRLEPKHVERQIHSHISLIKTMGLEKVLVGHSGCVNRLAWNSDGSYLVSGSDDRKLIVWNYASKTKEAVIQTNHEANIFGVAFLPHSNNSLIASCAGDCQVQLYSAHQLSSSGGSDAMVRNWGCHVGRVKSLAVEPNTPSLIWTASEDATVRQFDTRDDHTCRSLSDSSRDYDAECPSILINLREEVPSNTVKSVAVNAAFPNYMAIGCDDGTVRLYDRRMISRTNAAPVSIFSHPSPSSSDSVTHVAFSKSGFELLANVSCNYIYTYDIFDTEKRQMYTALSSSLVDVPFQETDQQVTPQAEVFRAKGSTLSSESRDVEAVLSYNESISLSPHSSVLYRERAAALLKRNWIGDVEAAFRDANMAISLNDMDKAAWTTKLECVKTLGKLKAARELSKKINQMFPSTEKEMEKEIERQHEEERDRERENENENSKGKGKSKKAEREEQGIEDDFENIVITKAEEKGQENKNEKQLSGSSSNDNNDDDEVEKENNVQSNETYPPSKYPRIPYSSRFLGHSNSQTDIKEACFIGDNDQFIGAGSDDGRIFIWDRLTGNLVLILKGDKSIVNCVQPHPVDTVIATSGIESTISFWSPKAGNGTTTVATVNDTEKISEIMKDNQRKTANSLRDPFSRVSRISLMSLLRAMRRAGVRLPHVERRTRREAQEDAGGTGGDITETIIHEDEGGENNNDDDDDDFEDDDDDEPEEEGQEGGETLVLQECVIM